MLRTIARLLSLALLTIFAVAAAPPTQRSLEQMKHTRWTTDDGAPAGIQALAQTRDGFLWIGSSTGLYRFDGKVFERMPITGAEQSVTALLATRDGRLLLGLQNGHVLARRGDQLADITPSSRSKRVLGLTEDRAGGIWVRGVAFDLRLVRLFQGRWRQFDAEQGIPSGVIKTVLAARDGAVWISMPHAVYVLRSGTDHFVPVAQDQSHWIDMILKDPAGHIWAASPQRGLWPISSTDGAPPAAIAYIEAKHEFGQFRFDKYGDIWGSVAPQGIVRLAPRASDARIAIERYGAAQGLSSGAAHAILEDREGTMWIGTSGGLDRFRPANVVLETAIPAQSPYGYILFADRRGTMYVADSDTLYRIAPGASPIAILKGLNNPMGLCEGEGGDIWVADTRTFYVVHNGIPHRESPPSPGAYMRCQGDKDGHPWFLSVPGDLYRRMPTGWRQEPTDNAHTLLSNFTFDEQGRAVLFYENRGLTRWNGSSQAVIWPVDRIPGGRLGVVHLSPGGLLASGATGLARIRDAGVDLLDAGYPWLQHVTGLAETRQGDSWIQSSLGIFRVRTEALQKAFVHPGYDLHPEKFDALDGWRGLNLLDYADNGAAVGGDGRVWFATTNGIVWIDPNALHHNDVAPPVAITRVIADGRVFGGAASIDLALGTKNLEIDYTALSLAMPERVAFRYRLEGADQHWVDPGVRRQAFYANLAPGDYRFRVVAANEDGVWNRNGADVRLSIPPTFLQSLPFKLICALTLVLALWALYRIRLNGITHRLKTRLDARLSERERIARELHDTLLQGVQGLILRFQGIADRLPRDQVPGRLMEKALDRAEELLLEGRERVHGLRSTLPRDDLLASLNQVTDNADLPAGLALKVGESGGRRIVAAGVQDELAAIAREALLNVVRHAHATMVDITITYGWRAMSLSIIDDGRGIDREQRLSVGERHFGIAGMHERAHRIGGALHVGPDAAGRGTRLVVRVPAGIAYPSSGLHRLRLLLGLAGESALA